jgi:predicted dehydrogenase
MSNTLGWGVIGCGDVVFRKSGPSILQADRSRIVAVMRRDPEQCRGFAEAHGIAVCTDDPEAIIGHADTDIVYVATPPSSHRPYVIAAARAGKHVLVEKPMGLSAVEDQQMIDACHQAGVELFVAYYRRFHPHVQKMKELIDSGRIGTPVAAQVDYAQPPAPDTAWGGGWRLQPAISGGGLFVDVVSHRIDVVVHLLGRPAKIHGLKATPGPTTAVEQAATVLVQFTCGAVGAMSGDFVSGRAADRFVIAGTEGVIESGRLDGHHFVCRNGDAVEEFRFEPDAAPHLGLVRHIELVLAGETKNTSSGLDGLQTDMILDKGLGRQTGPTNAASPAP